MLEAGAKGTKHAAPSLCSWGWGRSDGTSRSQSPSCLGFPTYEDISSPKHLSSADEALGLHRAPPFGVEIGAGSAGEGGGPAPGKGWEVLGGDKSAKTRIRGIGREDEEREERGGGSRETDCTDHLLRVLLIAWAHFSSSALALLQELPAMGAGPQHQSGLQGTLRDGAG